MMTIDGTVDRQQSFHTYFISKNPKLAVTTVYSLRMSSGGATVGKAVEEIKLVPTAQQMATLYILITSDDML